LKPCIYIGHLTPARLRGMRLFLGWSRQELARRSGLHFCTIRYWEKASAPVHGLTFRRITDAFAAAGYAWPVDIDALSERKQGQGARCGARTRQGTPCNLYRMQGKRRCRLHGGLSTGPKTEAGRERAMRALMGRQELIAAE
jgi:hypothetical protein